MSEDLILKLIVFSSAIAFTALLVIFKLIKKKLEMRGSDSAVDALRDEVEQLADTQEHTRAQLADMQERLDFAERLLTAGRASHEDRSG